MIAKTLFTTTEIDGKYNTRLTAADFCTTVPKIGTVFSISFSGEPVTDSPIQAKLTVYLKSKENEKPVSMLAEGKFIPKKRSLIGADIPSRIYLAIPENQKIDPSSLRSSRIEINSISKAEGKSSFDNFRVSY